jgi:hypothetical protein
MDRSATWRSKMDSRSAIAGCQSSKQYPTAGSNNMILKLTIGTHCEVCFTPRELVDTFIAFAASFFFHK